MNNLRPAFEIKSSWILPPSRIVVHMEDVFTLARTVPYRVHMIVVLRA